MPDPETPSHDPDGPLLDVGRNCWRIARADQAALIVDAADYFRLARAAMLGARSQILLIGWDLDTRIQLVARGENDGAPIHLGAFISWLGRSRPELEIYILPWVGEVFSFLGRGTTLARLLGWRKFRKNISFKLDSTHPHLACHHQKILVIDDAFASCGGIDMTGSRWDTSEHRDREPGRRRPTTRRSYQPWHDATMAVDGEAAKALGDLGRARWEAAGGDRIPPPPKGSEPWPETLDPDFEHIDVAIARTRGGNGDLREVREIETLFVDMIDAAERHVYMESQYFASRAVAEAIARRLDGPEPPEFVIVNPKSSQSWLEEEAMGAARAELFHKVKAADRHDRFRIYTPTTLGGRDIYVHAKIMIVDDRMLRVGSANLNNRSMGLDTECDMMIDTRIEANRDEGEAIAKLRSRLLGEHLGVEPDEVTRCLAEAGSLIATVERLRGTGRTLLPFTPPEYDAVAKAVAKAEVVDPESADAGFEPMAQHRLLRGLHRHRRRGERAG